MKSKTTIDINGKQYDAVTGAVLGAASTAPVRTGKNIDGFFRSRTSPATITQPTKISILTATAPHVARPSAQPSRGLNHARAHTPQPAKTVAVRVQNTAPSNQALAVHHTMASVNHAKHHAQQSSQTLMRASVRRPATSLLKQVNTTGTLQHAVPSLIASKQSIASIDANRLARAQTTSRSPQIAHHSTANSPIRPFVAPVTVQPAPTNGVATPPAPQVSNKPVDIFEHALANASNFVDMQAHTKHFKKHARQHVASMTAGALALLVVAGFAVYQNVPSLQLKAASVAAGVSTAMPNFKAAGFVYSGAKASDDTLILGFNGQNSKYQLSQQATNLSDSDMIQNIGSTDATGAPNYRTLQVGNIAVYRFDNTNATWVANGRWYTVAGNGALSDAQVKAIVQNV